MGMVGRLREMISRPLCSDSYAQSLGVIRRSEETSEHAPLFIESCGVELRDLLHAVGHHHADAPEELVIIFLEEGRLRHPSPCPCHRGLAAHEHWGNLDRSRTGRLVEHRQPDIHFGDFTNDAFLFFTPALYPAFSACRHAGQTISSLSRRALVGRLFFRHYLVVTPSMPLTPGFALANSAGYMHGLARDCLKERFPEFTRFLTRPISGSEWHHLVCRL